MTITHDRARAFIEGPPETLAELMASAREMRDRGRGAPGSIRGRPVTFSMKIFLPLTTLCRDYCGYGTVRRDPGQPGARTMSPDEVLALAQAGERLGAKEALFSLGDKPEALFAEHREFLRRHGHRTTLSYLRAVCELTVKETALLPHANPGVMNEREMALRRDVNVSWGIRLEPFSVRLLAAGMAHARAPDKVPARRLRTIALAGKLQIPFTTGILIGIGETPAERGAARGARRALHERYGHIQEVIVQNFRAKPGIPMRDAPEPSREDLLRTIAVARLVLGPEVNLQAPPNLSPGATAQLLDAGLNDWGGISPLTLDHINPERPWPLITDLRRETEATGLAFRERLAIYPEFAVRSEFVAAPLRARVAALVDADGLVKETYERWRDW